MRRRRSTSIALGVAAAATTVLGGGVATATQNTAPLEDGKYCATRLAKGEPGKASRIVARECADTREAATFGISALESTWLGEVAEHEYGKGEYELYFGDSGPCDKEGYRVDWIRTGMQNKASSFRGMSWCNDVTLFNNSHLNPSAGTWRQINAGQSMIIVDMLPGFNDLASSIKFQRNPND